MAQASARLTASTSVTSGIGPSLHPMALPGIGARELGIEMVEHRLGRARAGRQIARDGRLDALLAFGRELLLLGLAPPVAADQIGPQPRYRLLLPARLDLLRRAIARGV